MIVILSVPSGARSFWAGPRCRRRPGRSAARPAGCGGWSSSGALKLGSSEPTSVATPSARRLGRLDLALELVDGEAVDRGLLDEGDRRTLEQRGVEVVVVAFLSTKNGSLSGMIASFAIISTSVIGVPSMLAPGAGVEDVRRAVEGVALGARGDELPSASLTRLKPRRRRCCRRRPATRRRRPWCSRGSRSAHVRALGEGRDVEQSDRRAGVAAQVLRLRSSGATEL